MHTRMRRIAPLAVVAALLLSGCGLADARRAAIADAAVKPVDLATALRPGLVGLSGYPATGWESSGSAVATTKPSVASLLAKIGLRASDVRSTLQVRTMPDGTSLGIPTLDFCEGTYPSEELRVHRLQRATYDEGGAYAGLSTEVVVYKSEAAAQQALREAVKARVDCPVGEQVKTFDGHTIVFEFHSAPGPSSTPLVGANARLIIHTTMVVDGTPQTAFLVYQIDGRVLAALYALDSSGKPFTQAALDAFYGLAGDMATRLRKYSPSL